MHKGATNRISILLILGLALSCLFVLGSTSCQAFMMEEGWVHGDFCSAEQMQSPSPVSSGDTHRMVPIKDTLVFVSVIPAYFASLLLAILLTDTRMELFAKRMRAILTRYGPYQKIFLPYLMATHGM